MGKCAFILKLYLFLGAVFDVLIGIGCMFVAKEVQNLDSKLLVMDVAKKIQDYAVLAIFILGGITILTGIVGFFGILKEKRILKIFFVGLNVIYFIAFGAIFAANVYGKQYLEDNLPANDCSGGVLKDADQLFQNAKTLWCKQITSPVSLGCPCKILDRQKWSASQQVTLLTYNSISASGTENIQNCSDFKTQFGNSAPIEVQFLAAIESNFSCTGVCTGDIVYYFSDVNAGPPSTTMGCYPQVRQKIFDWLSLIYIYCLISAILCFLNILAAIIFGCVNKKDNNKKVQSTKDEEMKQLNP